MIQLSREEIEQLVTVDDGAVSAIEDAYISISDGRANVPPVGHIGFPAALGDCHIKYGHISGDEVFAVKIAAGFYGNPAIGLPSSNGVVLVFSAQTGMMQAVLNDEGYLTDLRTGLGGAIATFALCRPGAKRFLVVGSGTQAYWLARSLAHLALFEIRIAIWGRNPDRAKELVDRLASVGVDAEVVRELESGCRSADAILTATPASEPLIRAEWIRPGSHITALGADGPGKRELDIDLVARADVRVSDKLSQSLEHGEFSGALNAGLIKPEDCVELGSVLMQSARGRRGPQDITIADLTGVATQDIAMARTVLARTKLKN